MRNPKLWVPIAILGFGVLVVSVMVATRPAAKPTPPRSEAPLVSVVSVQPQSFRYVVRAQGTVVPRTESALVSQVAGQVVWVSPAFVSGGFFVADEPLVRIDPADYEVEQRTARAAVARTKSEFQRSGTERTRQRSLREKGVASQARIDDAENQYRVAEAQLREAEARLARAERDLARTELRAPFVGRVRDANVDVGQFVNRAESLGMLYAVDYAEVSLPIPDRELQFLDLALRPAQAGDADAPEARLHADFAGRPQVWTGKVVRTEGEIDTRSRMINLVARIEDPYGIASEASGPPLAAGLFVEAEIDGREVDGVFVLPRAVLRRSDEGARDQVLVVAEDGRLSVQPVEVLRSEREQVVLGKGLRAGDRVVVSPLSAAVDGMQVQVVADPAGDTGDAAPTPARSAQPAAAESAS